MTLVLYILDIRGWKESCQAISCVDEIAFVPRPTLQEKNLSARMMLRLTVDVAWMFLPVLSAGGIMWQFRPGSMPPANPHPSY